MREVIIWITRRIQSLGNDLASGLACALGGMLLLGVPSIALTVLALEYGEYCVQYGLPKPEAFDWLFRASAVIGISSTLLTFSLALIGIAGVPFAGFVIGWRMGMRYRPGRLRRRMSPIE